MTLTTVSPIWDFRKNPRTPERGLPRLCHREVLGWTGAGGQKVGDYFSTVTNSNAPFLICSNTI